MFIFIFYFAKSYFYLRDYRLSKEGEISKLYIISTAIVYSFAVEMFVRGIGYFTSTIFLFLVAVFLKMSINRHKFT